MLFQFLHSRRNNPVKLPSVYIVDCSDEPNMGSTPFPRILTVGILLTFTQFLFVALEGLPYHIDLHGNYFLKPRQIPLTRWITIVSMFFASSMLNNAALGYDVSIPIFIIVRSGGTFITMILSYLLRGKTYTSRQIAAVAALTMGVGLATYRSPQKVSAVFGRRLMVGRWRGV